jgi:hypothetical protein
VIFGRESRWILFSFSHVIFIAHGAHIGI